MKPDQSCAPGWRCSRFVPLVPLPQGWRRLGRGAATRVVESRTQAFLMIGPSMPTGAACSIPPGGAVCRGLYRRRRLDDLRHAAMERLLFDGVAHLIRQACPAWPSARWSSVRCQEVPHDRLARQLECLPADAAHERWLASACQRRHPVGLRAAGRRHRDSLVATIASPDLHPRSGGRARSAAGQTARPGLSQPHGR